MNLTIDAVAVVAKDLTKTLDFYRALGFNFVKYGEGDHYEATQANGLRLMIDTDELLMSLGQPPAVPASFANFAIRCETPSEVDEAVEKARHAGGEIVMKAEDMFWGQRYATIKDPNGNRIDIFAWNAPIS